MLYLIIQGGGSLDSVLIVSSSNKAREFFIEVLSQNSYGEVVTVTNGGEARRLLVERIFDLCIINSPLIDEFGDEFAKDIVSSNKLLQKIEDIKMIDRAKCILIQYLNMTESEAHRYIEKQAMDMRTTRKTIAEGILRTYEN